MTPDELHILFRSDIADTVTPYLWSDEEVLAYMNDAYSMFVRLTGGIPDALSSACTVFTTVNNPYSKVHPKILRIRQAELATTGEAVKVINAQDVNELTDDDYGVIRRLNSVNTIGKVRFLISGMQDDVVRWVNIPDAVYEVRMLIERLPLEPLTGDEDGFEGVKDHHHIHLLKWMRHLAHAKQDAETFDKKKSLEDKMVFEDYCQLAKREKDTRKHKVRVTSYGGL